MVIQRAYEEGEEELIDDEEGEDGAAETLTAEKDEKMFLLDRELHFRSEIRAGGEKVLAWKDLSGDPGDVFEFVCDESIAPSEIATFMMVAMKCQYERKYRKPNDTATDKKLQEFDFTEQSIPNVNETPSPLPEGPPSSNTRAITAETSTPTKSKMLSKSDKAKPAVIEESPTAAPVAAQHPASTEVLARESAELHLFDFPTSSFILQDPSVVATVSEVGKWQYWLQIEGQEQDWLGQPVIADINPVFNFEYLSFIFNHYTEDGGAYSWLLRFKDQETEERFQGGLMQALWEQLNETKWMKTKDDDRQYVLDAFQDLTIEDAPDTQEEQEEEEVEEVEDDGQRSEHYDTDESEDDVGGEEDDGNINSQLAVGYKHDRSFVVRGSQIGVFKHTPNNNLEFSTNIAKVQMPNGKLFSPTKVMLHAEDTDMILQNEANPNSLYRMDLEYGKVVDEWKIHDDIPVTTFAPEKVRSQIVRFGGLLKYTNNFTEIFTDDGRADIPWIVAQRTLPYRPPFIWQQTCRLRTQTIRLEERLLCSSYNREGLHCCCLQQGRYPHVRSTGHQRQNPHPRSRRAHHRSRRLRGWPLGLSHLPHLPPSDRRVAERG